MMNDRLTKVLMLAGGLGSRLRPLTDKVPKCLVPIGDRTLFDYWLDRFAEANLSHVLVNTHHLAEKVRSYIGQVNAAGRFKIRETFEPRLLGSAGTIAANRAWADDADHIVIVYADNLSEVDLPRLLAFHDTHPDPMTMLLFHAPDPAACGIATMDNEQRIIQFVEKPTDPSSDLANAGIYVVSADCYRDIADSRSFDLGFDILPNYVGKMRGFVLDGFHLDIGTPAALTTAENVLPTLFGGRPCRT